VLTTRWRGPGCPAWHLAWHPPDTVAVFTPASRQTASRARTISSVPIRVVASTISSVTSVAAPSWSPRCQRSRTSAAGCSSSCSTTHTTETEREFHFAAGDQRWSVRLHRPRRRLRRPGRCRLSARVRPAAASPRRGGRSRRRRRLPGRSRCPATRRRPPRSTEALPATSRPRRSEWRAGAESTAASAPRPHRGQGSETSCRSMRFCLLRRPAARCRQFLRSGPAAG
jgi:hypothetical protein